MTSVLREGPYLGRPAALFDRSFMYQANSWARPRKVVARLECSLQPDTGGEITSTGMRQEVDIRYVVISLKGAAQHPYENV